MLTVAEETLGQLAAEHGKDVSTHLFGQEINAETYAICTADLLLEGRGARPMRICCCRVSRLRSALGILKLFFPRLDLLFQCLLAGQQLLEFFL